MSIRGDRALLIFELLGGDGLAATGSGWLRGPCPAHLGRSRNSLAVKLDESSGGPAVAVFCFAGCSVGQILEAVGYDPALGGAGDPGAVLARTAERPEFRPVEDPARALDAPWWLERFCEKRGWDIEVAVAAGLTVVQHPHRWARDPRWRQGKQEAQVRIRFPHRDWKNSSTQVIGWQDRQIVDSAPGELRWLSSKLETPFGFELLGRARARGRVWLTEGPTDAVALRHALPGEAVMGVPGGGLAGWRGWWAAELEGLSVWTAFDADIGGDRTRRAARAAVGAAAADMFDVRIPRRRVWSGAGDVDEWRRAAGDGFLEEFFGAAIVAPEWVQ